MHVRAWGRFDEESIHLDGTTTAETLRVYN